MAQVGCVKPASIRLEPKGGTAIWVLGRQEPFYIKETPERFLAQAQYSDLPTIYALFQELTITGERTLHSVFTDNRAALAEQERFNDLMVRRGTNGERRYVVTPYNVNTDVAA